MNRFDKIKRIGIWRRPFLIIVEGVKGHPDVVISIGSSAKDDSLLAGVDSEGCGWHPSLRIENVCKAIAPATIELSEEHTRILAIRDGNNHSRRRIQTDLGQEDRVKFGRKFSGFLRDRRLGSCAHTNLLECIVGKAQDGRFEVGLHRLGIQNALNVLPLERTVWNVSLKLASADEHGASNFAGHRRREIESSAGECHLDAVSLKHQTFHSNGVRAQFEFAEFLIKLQVGLLRDRGKLPGGE